MLIGSRNRNLRNSSRQLISIWSSIFSETVKMAPTSSLQVRDIVHQLTKREKNWAQREVGVVVVFCIVFIVAVGLISLAITRAINRRRARIASRSAV
ncbi:hypothetical protein HYFRA_00004320 [Hymenoscyphus fraxineus]|uniref:Uncharacterized protein n=1 Tax=Hymenoscyphus fraxineus TaxID=746836 RepID=A0A9N9PNT0_9HELO|nr:hypothetical protein HYFRA_00004320 [Hymenoscyphus fraxineus]